MNETNEKNEIVEDAIAKRLAKLGTMPVDLSRLEAKMRSEVPARGVSGTRRGWWKSVAGIAASLILVGAVAFAMLATREVQASPEAMAQVYHELVEGKNVIHTSSVDQANKMIEAMAKGTVKVPQVPGALLHSCCMRNIQNKQVACVLLNNGGQPVAMTVAAATDMKSPKGEVVTVSGVDYHVTRLGELTMVMTERNGRWVCLVSKANQDTLVSLAAKLSL